MSQQVCNTKSRSPYTTDDLLNLAASITGNFDHQQYGFSSEYKIKGAISKQNDKKQQKKKGNSTESKSFQKPSSAKNQRNKNEHSTHKAPHTTPTSSKAKTQNTKQGIGNGIFQTENRKKRNHSGGRKNKKKSANHVIHLNVNPEDLITSNKVLENVKPNNQSPVHDSISSIEIDPIIMDDSKNTVEELNPIEEEEEDEEIIDSQEPDRNEHEIEVQQQVPPINLGGEFFQELASTPTPTQPADAFEKSNTDSNQGSQEFSELISDDDTIFQKPIRQFSDEELSTEEEEPILEENIQVEDYDEPNDEGCEEEEEEEFGEEEEEAIKEDEEEDSGASIHDGFSDVEDEIPAIKVDNDLGESEEKEQKKPRVSFIGVPAAPVEPRVSIVDNEMLCDFRGTTILEVRRRSKVTFFDGKKRFEYKIPDIRGCALTGSGHIVIADGNGFHIILPGIDPVFFQSPLCPPRVLRSDPNLDNCILVHSASGALYAVRIPSRLIADTRLESKLLYEGVQQFCASPEFLCITRGGFLEVRDRTESGFAPIFSEAIDENCQIGCDRRFVYIFDPAEKKARLVCPSSGDVQSLNNVIALFNSSGGAAIVHSSGFLTVCGQHVALLESTRTVAFVAVHKGISVIWESASTPAHFKKAGKKQHRKGRDPARQKAMLTKEVDDLARVGAQHLENLEMMVGRFSKDAQRDVSNLKRNLEESANALEHRVAENTEAIDRIMKAAMDLCASPEDAIRLYDAGEVEKAFRLASERSPNHCIAVCDNGRLEREAAQLPQAVLISIAVRLAEVIKVDVKTPQFVLTALSHIDPTDVLSSFAMKTIAPKLLRVIETAKTVIPNEIFNQIAENLQKY